MKLYNRKMLSLYATISRIVGEQSDTTQGNSEYWTLKYDDNTIDDLYLLIELEDDNKNCILSIHEMILEEPMSLDYLKPISQDDLHSIIGYAYSNNSELHLFD